MIRGALAALGLLLTAALPAAAQSYPTHEVRLIVPVAAGGGSDILARILGQRLSEEWHQTVIVDNRPGGGHIVGTTIASKAEPDGYTVLMMGTPHVVNPSLHVHMAYDSLKDFEPVAMLAQIPVVVVVNASFPAKSIAELVAAAKAKPGALSFASTSVGGAGHLAAEFLKMTAGIDMVHIPYRGSAPAIQDLLSGQVPIMFDALITAQPYIEDHEIRALAVTTLHRAAALPDVPTMAEAGYPGFNASAWLGLLVPAHTPAAAADALNAAVVHVLGEPDIQARLVQQGWELLPIGGSRAEFGTYLETEQKKWAAVIKAAGIKPE